MTDISEQEISAADLAAEVGAIVGSGRSHASYVEGDWVLRTHGARRLLSIGVTNSNAPRRSRTEQDGLLARLAQSGAGWLRRRGLPTAGTLVSVSLLREVDLRLVSWAWGVGGRAYWIDATGTLAERPPAEGAKDAC